MIERAKHRPTEIDPGLTAEQVAFLGVDPGEEVDLGWWEDMLVKWFEEPEAEIDESETIDEENEDPTESNTSEGADSKISKKESE